jgi:RNA polymerase sigma-70 factor (ECF subfamily)
MVASLVVSPRAKALRPPKVISERAAASKQEAVHDVGLVRRFNAGDESAFVEIVQRYRSTLFHVAYALLRNHADAEEIAQDALIRAHRNLARFRGDASLSAWLHCITLNLARNRYWYYFRRRRHATISLDYTFTDTGTGSVADLVASTAASPVRETAFREFSELIAACMQQLGTQPRQILTLRNTLNRSYEEIARELGISVGTVKSRIGRARASLRTLLTEACPEMDPKIRLLAWFDPVRPPGGVESSCA